MKERIVKIDLSLLPHFDNEHEFILWLAGFVVFLYLGVIILNNGTKINIFKCVV